MRGLIWLEWFAGVAVTAGVLVWLVATYIDGIRKGKGE